MSNNKILLTVFVTIFISMLGVGILIPVYPLLIVASSPFKIIPDTWTSQEGFILLGWLSATFPMAQFIAAPVLGQLADKFGRKKVLFVATFGSAIAYFLFAIALLIKCIPLLFISRIIDGATGGSIAVAQAVIADVSKPENRAKNFALVGMALGAGFIFGPVIGGVLSDHTKFSLFTASTPFYFAGFMCLINTFLVMKFLPETLKLKNTKRLDISKPFNNIIKAFKTTGLRNVMPSVFLFNMGFCFFTTFIAVILSNKYGFSQSRIGNFFAYVGILIFLSQAVLVRRLSNKVKDYQVLRYCMFGTSISLLAYYLVPVSEAWMLYLIPPLMSSCNAMTGAFTATLVTRITPENMRGEALGINSSVMALAQTFPAILSGYIASIHETLPTALGSVTVAIGGILFWILFKPNQFSKSI